MVSVCVCVCVCVGVGVQGEGSTSRPRELCPMATKRQPPARARVTVRPLGADRQRWPGHAATHSAGKLTERKDTAPAAPFSAGAMVQLKSCWGGL